MVNKQSSVVCCDSATFPKSCRLLSKRDFGYLLEGAQRFSSSTVFIIYKKSVVSDESPVGAPTRIGLSVSRRVGKSVIRNRIKRLVRQFFRTSPFRQLGVDVLIVVKTATTRSNEEHAYLVIKELQELFTRLARKVEKSVC